MVDETLQLSGYKYVSERTVAHVHKGRPVHTYVVKNANTVTGTEPIPCHTVTLDDFVRAIAHSLETLKLPVVFECEFDQLRLQEDAVLHHDLVRHDRVLGEKQVSDKATRIRSLSTNVNHAMILTGFHRDPETNDITRWQVENSHGSETKDGYLAMSHEWLRRHVLFAAIHPACPLATGDSEIVELPPFHLLAKMH
jgi:aminopeptidase C